MNFQIDIQYILKVMRTLELQFCSIRKILISKYKGILIITFIFNTTKSLLMSKYIQYKNKTFKSGLKITIISKLLRNNNLFLLRFYNNNTGTFVITNIMVILSLNSIPACTKIKFHLTLHLWSVIFAIIWDSIVSLLELLGLKIWVWVYG